MMSLESLVTIVRDEADTIIHYNRLLKDTECVKCKRLIEHIIGEEFSHIGECLFAISKLNPDYYDKGVDGQVEAKEIFETHEPML